MSKRAPMTTAECLDAMATYADRLRQAKTIDQAAWAASEPSRYIRVNGAGYRPVSLCQSNPCGAVQGFPGSRKRLDEKLIQALNSPNRNPVGKKPEHRLQASLIEVALKAPEKLPALLQLSDQIGEIRFVTDELRAGEQVRADVVFLGRQMDQTWVPIFVELKADRSLKRLGDQLAGIIEATRQAPEEFRRFLAAATGVAAGAINLSAKPIMVMICKGLREPSRARPDVFRHLASGIRVLEFYPPDLLTRESGVPRTGPTLRRVVTD